MSDTGGNVLSLRAAEIATAFTTRLALDELSCESRRQPSVRGSPAATEIQEPLFNASAFCRSAAALAVSPIA